MASSNLLTPDEAAARVRLSPSTLSKMRGRGDGPRYVKIGRLVAYDVLDIDAWIEDRKRSATSDRPEGDPASLCPAD